MTPTRIEFVPGHEDVAITEQDVAGKLLKMKAAGLMYDALAMLKAAGYLRETIGCDDEHKRIAAFARAALAAAEGRSLQEASNVRSA